MSSVQFTEAELAGEEWRDIPGFEGYQASNIGRVRSSWKTGPNPVSGHNWRILIPRPDRYGYPLVRVKGKNRFAHTMVLLAFVGPKPDSHECLHGDDCQSNNRVGNIKWGTKSQNYADRVRNGGGNAGERHGMAKLSDADVAEMRSLYATGEWSGERLGKKFGVSQGSATDAIKGKTFPHIPGAIPAPPNGRRRCNTRGGKNACAKLTDEQAVEIREMHAEGGLTHKQIAARFGVSRSTVSLIIQGKTFCKFTPTSCQRESERSS